LERAVPIQGRGAGAGGRLFTFVKDGSYATLRINPSVSLRTCPSTTLRIYFNFARSRFKKIFEFI